MSRKYKTIQRRAQAPLIDLMIGFVIFIVMFLINYQSWNSIRINIANNEEVHYFESSVYKSAEMLIKSPGEPMYWENNATQATFIGLADSENTLSNEKLNALKQTSYDTLKDRILSTGDYQIIISNNAGVIYQTGKTPSGEITTIRIDRIVMINGTYYTFTFKGWKA